ncbi:6-phosphogluconolactonase [Acididesulfobacillus acetoxydans]|uniref:6-phosphogluconolactonase n=1 Tax=Acididesulfobacillus acetoxydans TaxID=1561005 RepID=A0A8S0W730_9FIRM|nr:YncE family protein [Acididesulfobacillus acetoxydans]CAA7600329.1 6-phosphogluconolactonase [Acididesulfobacillus acetoxydans]CEJ06105.1 YVTN beta-propeller repeat protein [Acididesulfobacillus acetoxydans]
MLFETHAWVTLDDAVAVYNVYSDSLVATIPVGVTPYFPKLTPDGTKVLVPNFGSNTVSVVCTATNQVLATIPVGVAPTAVAVDPTSTTAYVTNSGSGTVSVISVPTDTVVGTISVGSTPVDVTVARDGSRVFVSNSGSNNVSVIDPTTNTVVQTLTAGTSPNGLTTSIDNTKLFVVNSGSNNVSVFSTTTNTLLSTIAVGSSPQKIAANPVNPLFVYVTNNGSNSVSVISTATLTVVATVAVGTGPRGLSVTGDGTQVWVANEGDSSVSIINTATNTIAAALPTAFPPRGVTVGRVGSALSPGEPIDLLDPYQLEEVTESVCIIVEKVYASCQQRECFPTLTIPLPAGTPPFTFVSLTFANGIILPGSIVITPIPSRPNFSRVQFTLQIPYTLTLKDATGAVFTLPGTLPDIAKDIVLYFPPTRPEFDLNLRVETRSELLASPLFTPTCVELAVGSFVVTKVTGLVQLLVPAFGYCPEPPVCEEFPVGPSNPCVTFFDTTLTPFPSDFFPPQLDNC